MMRQAGRYQKGYRELAKKHPSFRERSETMDLIVEITLLPWRQFRPDGVILFSDILTILPAIGISFEIDDLRGPIIPDPIRSASQLSGLHSIDLDCLRFIGESLKSIRDTVKDEAAVLGFVGAPWTIATYVVEGKSSSIYKTIKTMIGSDPNTLHGLLDFLANQIAEYALYQIESGAQSIQIFDSWGGQLTPKVWEVWSKPYIGKIVEKVRSKHPLVPLTLYANGSGGLLERMSETGVDVIGLDWTVDMRDARKRLGESIPVQGNVDPCVLFGDEKMIKSSVLDCLKSAGPKGHILNLGHGVIVGTPEENVKYMFDLSKKLTYNNISE
eukprot:g7392.t1